MKEPKQETPSADASQAAASAKKAEKVQSSRFEWESRAGDAEAASRPAVPRSKAARGSLMKSIEAWLKKFFSSNRDFFDKDDDATPSPA